MWEQIRANRVRSIILVIALGAFLVALGWLLGAAIAGSGIGGLVVALIVWAFLNLIAYFQGR